MDGTNGEVSRWIRAARTGEAKALDRLLGRYRGYLAFLARSGVDSTIGAKADPSDVAQDALLLAYEHFDQFRGTTEAEFVGWLRAIVARCLAMLVRRYRATAARDIARERAIEGTLDRSSLALRNLIPVSVTSPSQAAEARERCVILANALAELSEDGRRAIELRSIRQLAWEEVAAQLDRSAEASRKLWTRALKRLGEILERRIP
jgi:RNA polymerase sigma-70 factor (ECF subfamily)